MQHESNLRPRKIELGIYEEFVGKMKKALSVDGLVTILLQTEPKLYQIQFPRELLHGELPPHGTIIGLLRTKFDYRIKIEGKNDRKWFGADSVATNPTPVVSSLRTSELRDDF